MPGAFSEFSRSTSQPLTIASALSMGTPTLLLDEPPRAQRRPFRCGERVRRHAQAEVQSLAGRMALPRHSSRLRLAVEEIDHGHPPGQARRARPLSQFLPATSGAQLKKTHHIKSLRRASSFEPAGDGPRGETNLPRLTRPSFPFLASKLLSKNCPRWPGTKTFL
jgi:hypothetical protein